MYLQPLRLNPPCRMIVCRFEIVVSPGDLGVVRGKNRVRTWKYTYSMRYPVAHISTLGQACSLEI